MSTFHETLFASLQAQLADTGAPLFLGPIPAEGTAIGVSFYDVTPPEGTTDTVQGIQLHVRHDATNDRRQTLRLADTVFLTLHGQNTTTWDGLPIHYVWRNSSADLGPDDSGRVVRSDNYYIRLSRVGPHITDS